MRERVRATALLVLALLALILGAFAGQMYWLFYYLFGAWAMVAIVGALDIKETAIKDGTW